MNPYIIISAIVLIGVLIYIYVRFLSKQENEMRLCGLCGGDLVTTNIDTSQPGVICYRLECSGCHAIEVLPVLLVPSELLI
jgi:hypothetical protein